MQLSAGDIERLYQRDRGEPGILLMTLEGLDMPSGAVRLARNGEDFVSRGQTFSAAWFDAQLPASIEEQPGAQITVPNVNREVGLAVLEMQSALRAHIELVWPSEPDRVVMAWRMLRLRVATIDPLVVTGTLSVARLDSEPYGSIRVTPANFPWLAYV